jgi:hypothetical protein
MRGELRLVAALRRAARERGGPLPSLDVADALPLANRRNTFYRTPKVRARVAATNSYLRLSVVCLNETGTLVPGCLAAQRGARTWSKRPSQGAESGIVEP